MTQAYREALGWASDGKVWHRIEGVGGYSNRWDLGMAACHAVLRDPEIDQEPAQDAERCRDCWMIEQLPHVAEVAWGEPDDHLHVLTPGGVWPMRFGHYHGTERAEFRPGDPYTDGRHVTIAYECACGETLTASQPAT